jgi:uncharacterized membrane protein YbhN (UPF0104 family)
MPDLVQHRPGAAPTAVAEEPAVAGVPAPRAETHALLRHALLLVALAAAGAAALVFVPFLEPVRDRFADTEPAWVAIAFALQVLSTLSFVVAFRGAFGRRIGWRAAFDLGMVEQGANVILPSGGSGGLAIGAVFLVRAGVPTAFAAGRSAVLFLATSAVSFFAVIVGGALLALGVGPGEASLPEALVPAIGAAAIVLAATFLSRRLPQLEAREDQRVRHLLATVQSFLREAVATSVELIRSREWLLIGGSLGYFAFDVGSLAAAFEALGGGGPGGDAFVLAYVLGHGGALLPIPGSAEGGLVGAFSLYGSSLSLAVGAVLVYRTFHAGVPLLLSLGGLADIRRLRRDGPGPGEVAKRFG